MARAYETGTATDYKDLMVKVVDRVTKDAGLVGASQEWGVERCTWMQHITTAPELYFGAVNKDGTVSDFFNGQLDEVAIYHGELSAGAISTHYGLISAGNGANYRIAVATTDNAYNYWRLDEASGTTVTDLQANNNGTYNGTVTYSATGIFGAGGGDANNDAITLDGSTAYITTSTAGTQVGDNVYTAEMNFKTSNDGVVFSVKNKNEWYALEIVSGDLVFKNSLFQSEGNITIQSSVADGSYHHLVFVKDANHIFKVYYDGALVYTYTEPNREFALKGQGNASLDEIYIGARIDFDVVEDYYNWKLQGYSGFIRTQDIDTQPMALPADSYQSALLLWNTSIPYHIFATGRSIKLAAQVAGDDELIYIGLGKGYNFPNTNPYPLIVAGSSAYMPDNSGRRYSSSSNWHSNFFNVVGGYDAGSVGYSGSKCNFGTWGDIYNGGQAMNNNFETFPYCNETVKNDRLRFPNANKILYPVQLMELDNTVGDYSQRGKRAVMVFEDCYFTSSGGLSSGDTITIGAEEYIVFQNTFRSGRNQQVAIRKV